MDDARRLANAPRDSSSRNFAAPKTPASRRAERRQGVVFANLSDERPRTCETSTSSASDMMNPLPLPLPERRHQQQRDQLQHWQDVHGAQRQGSTAAMRRRTRTMDSAMLEQRLPLSAPKQNHRHRVGSTASSSESQSLRDEWSSPAASISESVGYHSTSSGSRQEEASAPRTNTLRRKQPNTRQRLRKRQSSRSSTSFAYVLPSVNALATPVETNQPARLMALMAILNGKMYGTVEYKGEFEQEWAVAHAYVDEPEVCLMCRRRANRSRANAGHWEPTILIPDLTDCIVSSSSSSSSSSSTSPDTGSCNLRLDYLKQASQMERGVLLLRLASTEERILWLAALLFWQQVRSAQARADLGVASVSESRAESAVQEQLNPHPHVPKSSTIIKVGTVMTLVARPAPGPQDIFQKPDRGETYGPSATWVRISCILHDNGDLRLLMEQDSSMLCIIQLSQLSRCAIQQLDRTVLDEEHCIAIFPDYASSAQWLSVFSRVYLSLEDRISFEVWFVLLRAFTVPKIYNLGFPPAEDVGRDHDQANSKSDVIEPFRVEKTVELRLTEAKIKALPEGLPTPVCESWSRHGEDPLSGDYFAEVILDGEVRAKTMAQRATRNPFWRTECEIADLPPTAQQLSVVLKRLSENRDAGTRAPSSAQGIVYGVVHINLNNLAIGSDYENRLPVLDERKRPLGSMLVKVVHSQHITLLAREYEPLTQMLHRFSTGLTTLISAALPGQLRRLSQAFLDIFQASGSALDWIMALVEDEIDGIGSQTSIRHLRFNSRFMSNESVESVADRGLLVRDMSKSLAEEANLLFRGNTLLTQSLENYMRRRGADYLESVLRERIQEIDERDVDFEVDPSKLSSNVNPADVDQRWTGLISLTTEMWLCIAKSIDKLPAELRHILKYIRAVAEDRYGDYLRNATYTAVSGFLFLRFICPAILSPKLWGLLRDHPQPRAQRTLTLIAKVLQKLSNLMTFGKHEEWLEPMNKFLVAQRHVFRKFIDQVCSIPAEKGMKNVPPSYSTPIAIQGRLPSTAREGFPSLPGLIDQTRSLAGLVKLWVDFCPLATKQGPVENELIVFNDVCHGLQRRADACLVELESSRMAEAESQDAERLAPIMERAADIRSSSSPRSLPPPSPDARRPPRSSGSDTVDVEAARLETKDRDEKAREAVSGGKLRGSRHVSTGSGGGGGGGTVKARNAKVGRTILSGIMRMGGRTDSPESKQHR